jgi:hypothetical protein
MDIDKGITFKRNLVSVWFVTIPSMWSGKHG